MRLAALYAFDLFGYLKLLSEAGAPTFCCEINDEPAIPTSRRIARYKLSEALTVILAALRARNLNSDEISGSASFSVGRHLQASTLTAEDQQ
jgi:hypothetical protein